MGDNREKSLDSRYEDVGLVDEKDIMGKVMIRLFPFNKIGKVD
jgi:signal peptidase I